MRDKLLRQKAPGEGSWTISKRQVVCSELSRAIRLFICDKDMISAHVLAGAAREIIGVAAAATGKPTIRQMMKDRIKPEFQAGFIGTLDLNYNFMKHGKRDIEAENEHYTPRATEMLIFECCADFYSVYQEDFLETKLFNMWIVLRYPDLFDADYANAVAATDMGLDMAASDDFDIATASFKAFLKATDDPAWPVTQLPLMRDARAAGPMSFKPRTPAET